MNTPTCQVRRRGSLISELCTRQLSPAPGPRGGATAAQDRCPGSLSPLTTLPPVFSAAFSAGLSSILRSLLNQTMLVSCPGHAHSTGAVTPPAAARSFLGLVPASSSSLRSGSSSSGGSSDRGASSACPLLPAPAAAGAIAFAGELRDLSLSALEGGLCFFCAGATNSAPLAFCGRKRRFLSKIVHVPFRTSKGIMGANARTMHRATRRAHCYKQPHCHRPHLFSYSVLPAQFRNPDTVYASNNQQNLTAPFQ